MAEAFCRKIGGQDGGQEGGQDGGQEGRSRIELTPAQNQVFRLIVENPKIGRRELENLEYHLQLPDKKLLQNKLNQIWGINLFERNKSEITADIVSEEVSVDDLLKK